jgi:hypothetical protein
VEEELSINWWFFIAGDYEQLHTFGDFANWLIPGAVMLGRYPYCEPSRCNSHEKGEQQLQKILEAGITTFISLQVLRSRDVADCLTTKSSRWSTCHPTCLVSCRPSCRPRAVLLPALLKYRGSSYITVMCHL